MKKLVFTVATVALASALWAADAKEMTPEEKRAEFYRKTGGLLPAQNSFKGKVVIIDTQDVVPADALRAVATRITIDSQMNFEYQKAAAGDPAKLLKDSGAVAAVIVVNDEKQPTSLIALEDGWGMVNVAKLGTNLKTDAARAKFVPIRTAHEVSRCATIVCGGYRSQFNGNILDVKRLEDLDLIDNGGIPMDRVVAMTKYLGEKGMTRRNLVTYRKACVEGWAPQPTNDVQKAIWDKAHSLPTRPIKVKYDPKKGE